MSQAGPPLLWLIIGPNGAGKSTYYETRIQPRLRAEFVNADHIARARWPEAGPEQAYEAAKLAQARRAQLLDARASFVAETVASHHSKLALLRDAQQRGYEVWVSFIYLESADLSVSRVERRVRHGGHPVPETKIRERYTRMVDIALVALAEADRAFILDNSDSSRPLRDVVLLEKGRLTWVADELLGWTRRILGARLEGVEE